MAADSTHPLYDSCAEAWQLVRDCLAGARKIKQEGERYLPRTAKQSDQKYNAYKLRANFFNACERTLQAFVGFIFRNNPEVTVPDSMAAFMKDATMTGKSFYDISKETVKAVLSVGKRGTLIDWQLLPENRPFILTYEPEDILNWKMKRIRNRTVLGLLVLREMSSEWVALGANDQPPDEYEHRQYEQLRIYEIIEDGEGEPYVQVTVKRKKYAEVPKTAPAAKNAAQVPGDFVTVDQRIPMRGGRPLSRIPFVIHGPETNELDIDKAPLEAIAWINVSHYRTSADLKNALHIAGVPTAIFCGFDLKGDDAYLGSSTGIVTDKTDAHAEFLSYDANQVAPLTADMDRDEAQMAALGARMLEKQGTTGSGRQEAFQTVQVRQSGDHSALMSATIACTQSLSDVLQWVAWWMDRSVEQPEDLDDTVKTELNTDFVEMLMDSPMLATLWTVYMGGGLSYSEFFQRLQKGGIISSERDMKDEIRDIQNDPVRLAELERQAQADAAAAAAAAKNNQGQQQQGGGGGAGGGGA